MIARLKSYLIRNGLYEKWEWSQAQRIYLYFRNPAYLKYQKNLERRVAQMLEPGSLVFDVGANVGAKTAAYLKAGCRVVAVEPDESNARVLTKRFSRNPLFSLVEKAVSSRAEKKDFYIFGQGSAYNTLSDKWKETLLNGHLAETTELRQTTVETTTLDCLIESYGKPDFIKIDVEGFESEVLSGLNQVIPLLSLEANLPEFLDETLFCIERLASLSEKVKFNYVMSDLGDLVLDKWQGKAVMQEIIKTTELRYLEIYARSYK
jgi:FkbM family methyltransferase